MAHPVPHHFTNITLLPDQTVTLSLDGSVSNMFNLTDTISDQFLQMFDLYVVEASTNHLLTSVPKPDGRFAVGMVDRAMVDPARTNLLPEPASLPWRLAYGGVGPFGVAVVGFGAGLRFCDPKSDWTKAISMSYVNPESHSPPC
jgi:hypothetical protein